MCAPSFTSSSELIRCYCLTKVSLPFLSKLEEAGTQVFGSVETVSSLVMSLH